MVKKYIFLVLILLFSVLPSIAQEQFKMIVKTMQEFSPEDIPEKIEFKTIKKQKIYSNIIIPQRSVITADVLQAQKERRWHKSGFIVGRIEYFINKDDNKKTDLTAEDIYIVVKKYEKINKKEAAITGTEIVLSQAASFFAPGVDILYFFTKGALQRKKHKNWFKAGVSNAYDNSIFWFWLKGKPVDLKKDETVLLKSIKEKRAYQLKHQIEKRKIKQMKKNSKKEKIKQ